MAFWSKKSIKNNPQHSIGIIDANLHEIRQAVGAFAEKKRDGISLKVLVKENNELDSSLLAPHLGGIPSKSFYMSKETFELFEEENRHIPFWIDAVQRAVDAYIRSEKAPPIIEGDPYKKISFFKLEKKALLTERPPLDFYFTEQESMVTHRKREK
ncbi:DUF3939 domain-containing protein [Anaerobacillus sp. 1_MG-2023]|uniref:DUF3939 domain-containing protein n=1 Tax=Bacillales TaxID=1385 RepID=UPI0026E19EC2|nr:DUF3939 domain-containing protein [Anaerobacillus sp. 1_MG-2023]MDO6656154.1 DUF3939 domain-containing protein [Anaerobacillus sp. 1_MG-2023]